MSCGPDMKLLFLSKMRKMQKSARDCQKRPEIGQSGGECTRGGGDELQGEIVHSSRTPHSTLGRGGTLAPLRTPLGEVARRNLLQLGWNGGVCDPSTLSARRHRSATGAGGRNFPSDAKRRGRRPKSSPKCDTTGVDKTGNE